MKEKTFLLVKHSDGRNSSSHMPSTLNDSLGGGNLRVASSIRKRSPMQPTTYPILREAMKKLLEQTLPGKFTQPLSNLNTAMNQYLGYLAIPADAVVGIEFRSSYHKLVGRHLAALKAAGRSEQSIRDRKSLLKKWRMLFVKLEDEYSALQRTQSPFVNALNDALPQGISLKIVAKQAAVPYSSLTKWRSGKLPTGRSLPALRRLERFLAMQPGQLTDFVAPSRTAPQTSSPPLANPYRERLKKQRAAPYRLASVSAPLKEQWGEFLAYKTSPLLFDLQRSEKGLWSISPLKPGATKMEKLWYARTDEDSFVPTAEISWGFVTAFLGWLSLQDGWAEETLTLSLFTDLGLVNRYLGWYLKQAGGKFNGGHLRFVSFVLSLVHPRTGYLTQRPELRSCLKGDISAELWTDRCSAVYTKLKEHKKVIQKTLTKSRDPDTPVSAVLALENPMLALNDMRCRIRALRPTSGTITEALRARDLLLIGLMMCSPLRAKNLKHLTYRADNTGNLRLAPDGTWQVEIVKEHFKNRDGAASKRKYRIDLDPTVYGDIESYLRAFRPMLLRGDASASDYLFVSSKACNGNGPWDHLNRRIESLTAKFLMQCPGVGPQAVRHIVATAIVKAAGEYNTAALVLHDEEETVKTAYAHLLPEDGHARYRKLFPDVFKG